MAKNGRLCTQLLLAFQCIKEWAINPLLLLGLTPLHNHKEIRTYKTGEIEE
jgi:hypothetical protein